jgi:transposase-like protein
MAKKRVWRHSNDFRRMAGRFNSCENIVALAKKLGIQRRLLYKWRKDFEASDAIGDPALGNVREAKLRKELVHTRDCLLKKHWRSIFSEAPCKESRLDGSGAAPLAKTTSTTTSAA